MNKIIKSISVVISLLTVSTTIAGALPDPLSLQQALKMADDTQYYQLLEAQASLVAAQSDIDEAEAVLGFRAQIEVEAAYIDPSPIAFDQSANDSRVSLRLIKPVYYFGSGSGNILAAQTEQQALQNYMPFIIGQRKIDIARQFFEIILSDLKFAWDNESMAVSFVAFDADKDRHALSQLSDVELLESENEYIEILHERRLSEMNQRYSRAVLANLLNRPEELPSTLSMPSFNTMSQVLPDYPILLEQIMQKNPQIKLAGKQLEAASQRVSAAANQFAPRLDAELEVSEHARIKGSNDEWRAQLNLVIPLYENSSMKREVSLARAEWLSKRANLLSIKIQVRKQVLNLWQSINVLAQRQKQLQTSKEFRELRLDKSRALYEMEVKTNLGSSMIAISEIQYKQAKNDFELILARMQLRLLAGEEKLLD